MPLTLKSDTYFANRANTRYMQVDVGVWMSACGCRQFLADAAGYSTGRLRIGKQTDGTRASRAKTVWQDYWALEYIPMGMRYDESTSSELRHDWLADRWVIIAPHRSGRPQDFERRPPQPISDANCPFCHGQESQTPEAVASYGGQSSSDEPDWSVRVVPNKFPAVRAMQAAQSATRFSGDGKPDLLRSEIMDFSLSNRQSTGNGVDLFLRRDLSGGHEVIVESPQHLQSISQLDRESVGLVFQAYRDRLAYWLNDCDQVYAVVFKNVGQDAGASLFHSHSQLIATDILPTDLDRVTKRMQLFQKKEGECLFCRMKDDEIEQGVRLVEETRNYVAFCPFASRLPSMINVVPKQHQSEFESLSNDEIAELSWLMHRLVRRVEKCFPDAAYNYVIHTAPRRAPCLQQQMADTFHWRLELFPRLVTVAGFEWGSDCYINPLAPEYAAAALRKAGV